jgi:hypothetical protein
METSEAKEMELKSLSQDLIHNLANIGRIVLNEDKFERMSDKAVAFYMLLTVAENREAAMSFMKAIGMTKEVVEELEEGLGGNHDRDSDSVE